MTSSIDTQLSSFYCWQPMFPKRFLLYFSLFSTLCWLHSILLLSFSNLPDSQNACIALTASAILFWLFEVVPAYQTALFIPPAGLLFGIFDFSDLLHVTSNPVIILFVAVFLITRSVEVHHLHQRFATTILHFKSSSSLKRISRRCIALSFFMSMWLSNTATAALLVPIIYGVLKEVKQQHPEMAAKVDQYHPILLIMVGYAATLGGVCTPIGSPPNLIVIGLLEQRGIAVTFPGWMCLTLPFALAMLAALYAVGRLHLHRLDHSWNELLQKPFELTSPKSTSLTSHAQQTCVIGGLTIAGWLLPGGLSLLAPSSSLARLSSDFLQPEWVAVCGAALLFLLPLKRGEPKNLAIQDIIRIDWKTIALFGGGLSLSHILINTNTSMLLEPALAVLQRDSSLLFLPVVTTIGLGMTEIMSNTASCSILVAILLPTIPEAASLPQYLPALAVALACNCSFMLPVATPPNAIVYGTGLIPLRMMMRWGVLMNFSSLAVLFAGCQLVLGIM